MKVVINVLCHLAGTEIAQGSRRLRLVIGLSWSCSLQRAARSRCPAFAKQSILIPAVSPPLPQPRRSNIAAPPGTEDVRVHHARRIPTFSMTHESDLDYPAGVKNCLSLYGVYCRMADDAMGAAIKKSDPAR